GRQPAELRLFPGDLAALDIDTRERAVGRDQQHARGRDLLPADVSFHPERPRRGRAGGGGGGGGRTSLSVGGRGDGDDQRERQERASGHGDHCDPPGGLATPISTTLDLASKDQATTPPPDRLP